MKTTPFASGIKQRVRLMVAILTLVALLLPGIPARAIWNGDLENGAAYSNVGIVFTEATDPKDEATHGGPADVLDGDYCSGILIAPELVLTDGGCVGERWDKFAYFSPVPDFDPLYDYGADGDPLPGLDPWEPGDPICDEDTCFRGEVIRAPSSGGSLHGLAVLRLDADAAQRLLLLGITPATLPAYDSLNTFVGQPVTSVGYGNVACEGSQADCDAKYEDENYVWLEDITGRHLQLSERRSAVMEVIAESGDWPKNGNKFLEVRQTAGAFNCEEDAGGGNFLGANDPNGVLVAITFDFDCSPVTDVLRLDTSNARNFLCSKRFPELAVSSLCGSITSATAASADDGGKQSADDGKHRADRQHKAKKGGKHHNKGKRGH